MEYGYFFTGFPGFICNQLIREAISKTTEKVVIYALYLPAMKEAADKERKKIIDEANLKPDQFQLLPGDITIDFLGIEQDKFSQIREEITHVFHLAAIYDLAVPKEAAYSINVEGTRKVNEWVMLLPNLKRYTYFSTGYVAGKREGILYEHELIKPDSFKNYYEETKYEAEVLVEKLKKSVPVTIIRPGIVKGHTKTGETIKFDGPYFMMNFLDRLRFLPVIPRLGSSEAVVNIVPIEYIIEAAFYLSFSEKGRGRTYHLTDPHPYKVSVLYEMLMLEMLGKKPVGTLPLSFAKYALLNKHFRRYLGVEKEALDYFSWLGYFDSSQAQIDLKGSNIYCPDFKDGVTAMTAFYLENKNNVKYQVNII